MSDKIQNKTQNSEDGLEKNGQEDLWYSEEETKGPVGRSVKSDLKKTTPPVEDLSNKSETGSDIYGVKESLSPLPPPVIFQKSCQQKVSSDSKPTRKVNELDHFKKNDSSSISLDDLYERRNRHKDDFDEEHEIFERTALPENPFWDRFFHPFVKVGFLIHFFIIAAAAVIPIFLVLFFMIELNTAQRTDIAGDLIAHSKETVSIFSRTGLVFLAFFWGILSFPYSVFVLEGTSAADDDLNEWPEFSVIGAIGMFCRLVLLILIAAIPAGLACSVLPISPAWGLLLACFVLLPIFLLSTFNADAMFILLTKDIIKSFYLNRKQWVYFYCGSFILLAGSFWSALAAVNFVERSDSLAGASFIAAIILSFLLTLFPVIWLRFLGRLAWIIDDTVRKKQENDENDKVFEENGQEKNDI